MKLYARKNIDYKILSIFLFVIIICGGVFIYHLYKKSKQIVPQVAVSNTSISVVGLTAKQVDVVNNQEFTAKVVGRKSVDVIARVAGNVSKINFAGGQYVNKGDVLFEVDEAPFLTKIYAPISGFINTSKVENGNLIYANSSVLTSIVESDFVYLDVFVAENILQKIALRSAVEVISLNLFGAVVEMDGALNLATGSAKIRAKVQNVGRVLKPNSFVDVRLFFNSIKGFLIPQNIAFREPDGVLKVFVVRDGVAKKIAVYEADIFENNWVITKGLSEGDVVISSEIQKVRDGMAVSVN
jgi:multidrug efflux pump subunit AcrA (membrane-fusion protein)